MDLFNKHVNTSGSGNVSGPTWTNPLIALVRFFGSVDRLRYDLIQVQTTHLDSLDRSDPLNTSFFLVQNKVFVVKFYGIIIGLTSHVNSQSSNQIILNKSCL